MFLPILLLAALAAPTTTPAAKQQLRSALGAIVRGQGSAARLTLQSVAPSDLGPKGRTFRMCALSRLGAATPLPPMSVIPAKDRFTRDLLALYPSHAVSFHSTKGSHHQTVGSNTW